MLAGRATDGRSDRTAWGDFRASAALENRPRTCFRYVALVGQPGLGGENASVCRVGGRSSADR